MLQSNFDPHKTFTARGEIYRGEKSVEVTITGRYAEHSFDPVECVIIPHESLSPIWSEEGRKKFLQVRGKTSLGKELWIPRFEIRAIKDNNLDGIAEYFAEGDLEILEAKAEQIIINLTIPSNEICEQLAPNYIHLENGAPTVRSEPSTRTIKWRSEAGEDVALSSDFGQSWAKTETYEALVLPRWDGITLSFDATDYVSLKDVVDRVWNGVEDEIWLLSLLSRKYIPWYEGDIFVEGGNRNYHVHFRRHRPLLARKESRKIIRP